MRPTARVGPALALAIILGAFTIFAVPVAAETASPIVASLVSISPQVRGTESLRIEIRAPAAAPADSVRVTIFVRETRVRVRQIADGAATPSRSDYNSVVRRVSETLDPARQTLVLNLAYDLLPQTPGVYPVQITVGSSKPITTFLVRVGSAAAGDTQYTVSFVILVRSATADQPDGSIAMASSEVARIDALATVLDSAPAGSVTVVPNPETLDALDASGPDARATLEHLQRASRADLVLGSSFVPIDIDAWRRAGHDDHVTLQLRTGRDVAARSLGRSTTEISTRAALLGRYDTPGSLEALRREGTANVVVADTLLEPVRPETFPSPFAQTFRVRDSSNQDLLAASADSWLTAAVVDLDRSANHGVVAQQVFADIAAAFFDHPNLARGSMVVLPADWMPSSRFVESLLKPLSASSLAQLRDLDGYFATVSRANPVEGEAKTETLVSGPMRRSLVVSRGPDVETHAADIGAARAALASYAAIFGPAASGRIASFDELLLASSDERLTAEARRAYSSAATAFVERAIRTPDGRIAFTLPESERITLTSRRETIRLVVENRLTVSVTVRIDLRSEKLSFPGGASLTNTLQPGPNTVTFDVSVKTSGDSLLEYTVNAPQGSIGELAKGKLRVRSIALSGLGVVLSILAVLVLITWWIRHGVRARRSRRVVSVTA